MPAHDVIVREVGLRDGLQNVAKFFRTDSKLFAGSKVLWPA